VAEVDEEVDGVVSVWQESHGGVEQPPGSLILGSSHAERSVAVADEENVDRNVEDEERAASDDERHRRWSHLSQSLPTYFTSHKSARSYTVTVNKYATPRRT